ncbi:MAG: GNAT family protein [Candidatus Melainabacteria bacterium]|nr:GNAT family protein [Candidatus Melainabacteria bacterium]
MKASEESLLNCKSQARTTFPFLRVVRIVDAEALCFYQRGLASLFTHFNAQLWDEACQLQALLQSDDRPVEQQWFGNVAQCVPYLWLAVDPWHQVWAAASLTDCVVGRHAYLHGISHPSLRRHPAVTETAMAAIDTAYEALGVLKVKAEFEANNIGATGFCRRFGFVREAMFEQDNRVQGQLCAVVVYSLFANAYYHTQRRMLTHVIRTQKKRFAPARAGAPGHYPG